MITLSTKNYTSDTGNHFRVEEDTILYYNGKQFLLTNSIQELIGIINVPYRKEEMIENTSISKRWYWKKGALAYWYSEDDGGIRFFKSKEDYDECRYKRHRILLRKRDDKSTRNV